MSRDLTFGRRTANEGGGFVSDQQNSGNNNEMGRDREMKSQILSRLLEAMVRFIAAIYPLTFREGAAYQRTASLITSATTRQVLSMCSGVRVGCTRNMSEVSPSSCATGKRFAGLNAAGKACSR